MRAPSDHDDGTSLSCHEITSRSTSEKKKRHIFLMKMPVTRAREAPFFYRVPDRVIIVVPLDHVACESDAPRFIFKHNFFFSLS